ELALAVLVAAGELVLTSDLVLGDGRGDDQVGAGQLPALVVGDGGDGRGLIGSLDDVGRRRRGARARRRLDQGQPVGEGPGAGDGGELARGAAGELGELSGADAINRLAGEGGGDGLGEI